MVSCFRGKSQNNCGVDSFYQQLEEKCKPFGEDIADPTIEVVKIIVGQSLKKYAISEDEEEKKIIKIKIKQEKDRHLTFIKENLVVPNKLEFEISFSERKLDSEDPIFYIYINFKAKKIAAPFTENEGDDCLMVWKQIRFDGANQKYTIIKQVFQKNKPVYHQDGSPKGNILEFGRVQLNQPLGSSTKKA
ncbi:MAG: hypothetical protein AAGG81_06735 [Chlamydiota bacterium]